MMRLGCLKLLFLVTWPVVTILVVAYAPGSWFTGFVWGFGTVEAISWVVMRNLPPEGEANTDRPLPAGFETVIIMMRAMGTGVTAVIGAVALFFLAGSIALISRGDFGPNLTGASMMFGLLLNLTLILWNTFRRLGAK